MGYGDDQCEGCGGIRVEGSNLCVNCLVALCPIRLQEIEKLEEIKKELKEKVEKLSKLVERLLDHITQEAVYTGILSRKVIEMMHEAERVKQEI